MSPTRTRIPDHPVRRFNKYVLNPLMLRLAGRPHWYASVLHHVGRRTGRRYATPVVALPVDGGFVVPLPYGADTDWIRNVLHAGRASITRAGHDHEVTAPVVVDAAAVRGTIPAARSRAFDRFGVTEFLRVRVAPSDGDPGPVA